jgi:hypothetical protein
MLEEVMHWLLLRHVLAVDDVVSLQSGAGLPFLGPLAEDVVPGPR